MRKYMCPKCKEMSIIVKKYLGICLNCGYEMSLKGVSRLDLYHKKHIEKPKDTPIFITPEVDLIKKTKPIVHKSLQHFERLVSNAVKSIPDTWYMKIQVNPMAHQPTVGDFMILTPTYNIVLECKELNISKGSAYFSFSRITQLQKLLTFQFSLNRNRGFIGIYLYSDSKKDIYIIPINVIQAVIELTKKTKNKNGLTITELEEEFKDYKIPYCNLENYVRTYWL